MSTSEVSVVAAASAAAASSSFNTPSSTVSSFSAVADVVPLVGMSEACDRIG